MRRLLAALFLAGLIPTVAAAQAPPAVPALPDATRLTTYSVSASTCICSVGFALYGDGTDVDEWIEVWLAGTKRLSTDPTYGWSLSSATGSLATIPRPITDAVLTFTLPQTGTVQIVGARRPRRTSQFNENRGVAARDLNQVITDQVATQRETWDLKSRMFLAAPGSPGGTVSGIFTTALLTGTSTTSNAIGTGSKTFTTQAGLAFAAGARLRASANSDLTQWVEGIATAYTGTSLTINVDTTNGSGTFASWTFNIAGAGTFAPLAINPPLSSTTRGLVINQTTPNAGNQGSTEIDLNSITAVDGINLTGGAFTAALKVEQDLGSNVLGQKAALYVASRRIFGQTATTGDQIGTVSFVQSSVSNGGTNTGAGASGAMYGINPILDMQSGAVNFLFAVGGEVDAGIQAGASAKWRFGWSVINSGTVLGAGLDAAIDIGSGAAAGSWKNAILLESTVRTVAPLATTGCVICTDGVAATIATGIDLSAYTISGNFLAGPGSFTVDGSGNLGTTGYVLSPHITAASGLLLDTGGNSTPIHLGGSQVIVDNVLASTSKTTGSLIVGGGLGVAGSLFANAVVSAGDPGGTASANTLSNASSTTISTGVGSVRMSSANPGTNAVWIKVYAGVTAYWIPGWTTNSP